jgi:hypothetical protein
MNASTLARSPSAPAWDEQEASRVQRIALPLSRECESCYSRTAQVIGGLGKLVFT